MTRRAAGRRRHRDGAHDGRRARGRRRVYMASLPLDANVLLLTVMATRCRSSDGVDLPMGARMAARRLARRTPPPRHPQRFRRARLRRRCSRSSDIIDDIMFVHPKDMQDGKVEISAGHHDQPALRARRRTSPSTTTPARRSASTARPTNHVIDAGAAQRRARGLRLLRRRRALPAHLATR